jgi:hypothetical protein
MVRLVPFAEAMKTVLAGAHGDALVPSSRLRNERSCIRFYPRTRDRSSGRRRLGSVWLSIPFYPHPGDIMG